MQPPSALVSHRINSKALISFDAYSVQPPGTIHAVFTPAPYLCVGGHFYTAATFADTINTVRMQLSREIHVNGDLDADALEVLTFII